MLNAIRNANLRAKPNVKDVKDLNSKLNLVSGSFGIQLDVKPGVKLDG